MPWRRLGRIYEPEAIGDWATTHAAVPFVGATCDGGLELFFSPRDRRGRSYTARATLSLIGQPPQVSTFDTPVLKPGELGAFDDSGAMGTSFVRHEAREYLYYNGWNVGVTVPFTAFVGCAVKEEGASTFERVSRAPVVGRTDADPLLAMSAWVIVEDGCWRMWYVTGVEWVATESVPRHRYRITYGESSDGLSWRPSGKTCIDFSSEAEYAIARPCVVRDGDRYRMWFSSRGSMYRIGYAESNDGIVWDRDDKAGGLEPVGDGWESESVEYSCVFDFGDKRWMLYNGNGYGMTGIGLAVLEGLS